MAVTNPVSAVASRSPAGGSGKMVLAWEGISQKSGAAITTSDEVTGMEVTNIARKNLDEIWRADTLAGLWAKIDQGDPPTPVRLLTINGSNLTAVNNLLTRSHDVTHADWTETSGAASADTTLSDPDNGLSAAKFIESGLAGLHSYSQVYAKPAVAISYYTSLVAQDNGRDVSIRAGGAAPGTDNSIVQFDLSAGTAGSVTDSGSFTAGVAAITDLGSGWYRCSLSGTTDTSAEIEFRAILTKYDGTLNYTGDSTSGIQMYSHDLVLGTTTGPTTIPITTAANGALIHVEAAQTDAGLDAAPPISEVRMYAIEDDLSAHHSHGWYLWLDAPESYRWWRVTIYDVNNADAVVDVGRLEGWNPWQPTRNMPYDWTTKQVEVDGDNRRRREAKFELRMLTEAAMYGNAFDGLDRARGTRREVVFIANPEATTDRHKAFIYGEIVSMGEVVHHRTNKYNKNYSLRELLP